MSQALVDQASDGKTPSQNHSRAVADGEQKSYTLLSFSCSFKRPLIQEREETTPLHDV